MKKGDILPKKLEPLIQLSDDGRIYILRAEYVGSAGFERQKHKQMWHYVRKLDIIDMVEYYINDIGFDRLTYLTLDVYYGCKRSTLESTVIVDKRDVKE